MKLDDKLVQLEGTLEMMWFNPTFIHEEIEALRVRSCVQDHTAIM